MHPDSFFISHLIWVICDCVMRLVISTASKEQVQVIKATRDRNEK
jgi:hypothetical protein